ncbi:hypothetical protein FVEG_17453 [Fusarium verticillioides 7600]|uniref:Uncharacterized protein n=1 Tax=Gibberella moniliformis (strain M3125 / FGSC 7600) TaxID=334819 RepID=W7MU81_GIBM7|nr:hypothetical protein FVEG_17453 [Fusarium verticillioides 7600]EWG55063.1 hypothetical protein FVEG_17453 [Fusarium verticillioides 7600]
MQPLIVSSLCSSMTAKISLGTYISTTQRDSVHLRIPFRIPALKADHMQQALDVAAEDPFLTHPLDWVHVSMFNHEHYNVQCVTVPHRPKLFLVLISSLYSSAFIFNCIVAFSPPAFPVQPPLQQRKITNVKRFTILGSGTYAPHRAAHNYPAEIARR